MSAELAPCPFCGSVAHLLIGMVEFVDVEVTCTVCAATGGNENNGATEAENRATAIAAWNRRTPPAPTEAVAWRVRTSCGEGGFITDAYPANGKQLVKQGYTVQPLYTHPPQPDALPGDLREKVARIIEAAIERHEPDRVIYSTFDEADAILALIQTERAG